MKKLKFLFLPTILALAFGLMLSCAKSSSDDSSSSADTSSSSAVTISGKVQKGPYIQGTEITVRELDSSMIPTGNTFTGTIDDNTGSFSIKGTLTYKIVELSALGYYFNEVSGSLSNATLTLSALSDLTDSSSVNVNLMTHLEKKRVEYLIDNSKMTFAAAKTQAQTEILKIFNIENVTLGNSETLDISKSGDGNAALLAISAILQSNKTEAELTELLSTINTDIRTDGTMDSTITKATLVAAMEYVKPLQSTIRSNIETRYNTLGLSVSIPSFETYILKLDTTVPAVSSVSPTSNATTVAVNSPVTASFSDYMASSSITTSNFYLQDSSSNTITSSVSYSGLTATLTPSSNLSENSTISATLTTNVTDLAGNGLASNYSWSFKTGDFTAPIVAEVTAVTTPTSVTTPSYTFSSTEAGTITYGGSCSSSTTAATTDNNTIDFSSLSDGTYNCTIKVTDSSGNTGNTLTATRFIVDTDTTAPSVSSSSPSDSGSGGRTQTISVTFSEGMDNSTITTNTSDTTCSGSLQVSSNNFSSCIQMSSSPSASNSNKTFSVSPSSSLSSPSTYKIRVTTGVKDDSAHKNSLATQWTTSNGYSTTWTIQSRDSAEEFAWDIAIDNSSGNIYVAGRTDGGIDGNTSSGGLDLFVAKYNSSGTKQWTRQLGTSSTDWAFGVALDTSENVYVAGRTSGSLDGNSSAGNEDMFLVKYNSSGTKQWTQQLGTSETENVYSIATDSSGNIFVTGSTLGDLDDNSSTTGTSFLVKYNSSGTNQWIKQVAGSWYGSGVATDSSGNIYLMGSASGSIDGKTYLGSCDLFVIKYNSAGTKQWTTMHGTTGHECPNYYWNGIAVDSSGNIFVSGGTTGAFSGFTNAGSTDIYVVKLNSSGTVQWTQQLGSSYEDNSYDLVIDSSSNIYVVGNNNQDVDFDGNTSQGGKDIILIKYNTSGTKQWSRQYGSSDWDYGRGIAIDNSNNIYVTGYTAGSIDNNTVGKEKSRSSDQYYDYFILKYDSNGNKQ